MIVVSDGRNYQFNPTNDKNISIEEVIDQAKRHGTRFHVIGFGVPEGEVSQTLLEYQRLASETGGSYAMQIANALELIENVQSITKPEQFYIQSPTGEHWIAPCESPFPLPIIPTDNTPFKITYRGQTKWIPVSPFSAITLLVGQDQQLTSGRLKQFGEPITTQMITRDNSATPFQLSVHPPKAEGNDRIYTLSIPRLDGEVSQRPRFVWIEIEPSSKEPSLRSPIEKSVFAYAEPGWIAHVPVPALHCVAKNWPSSASQAIVRFWCTDKPPSSIGTIDLKNQKWTESGERVFTATGQIKPIAIRYLLKRESNSLQIVLMHDDKQASVFEWFPKLEGAAIESNALTAVQRSYSETGRASVHRFVFADDALSHIDTILRDCSVTVMDVAALKENSLTTASPIVLSTAEEIATVPLSREPLLER